MKNKAKQIQIFKLSLSLFEIDYWKGSDISLQPNKKYSLIISYPFEKPYCFVMNSGKNGVNFPSLLRKISKYYDKAFSNANKENNHYWHSKEELYIESIQVNHSKSEINLIIGS